MGGPRLITAAIFLQLTWTLIILMAPITSAGVSINVMIQDNLDVHCYSFAGDVLQRDFGNVQMSVYGMPTLELPILDATTSNISCHFLWAQNKNAFQMFSVFEKSGPLEFGVAVDPVATCFSDCRWTVDQTGFLLLNTADDQNVLVYRWAVRDEILTAPAL